MKFDGEVTGLPDYSRITPNQIYSWVRLVHTKNFLTTNRRGYGKAHQKRKVRTLQNALELTPPI